MNQTPRRSSASNSARPGSIHGGLWKFFVALPRRQAGPPADSDQATATALFRTIFGKKYPPGINEDEAEQPLWTYPSLNALFTRGIKPEFRPIPAGTPQFLCPCDGTVQDVGRVERDKILTLKGIEYTLELACCRTSTREPFENGHYAIVFLSPIDCHRVFSPQDGQLEEAIHVPGYRLPVHPPCQRAEYPVYALNERMILRLSTALGRASSSWSPAGASATSRCLAPATFDRAATKLTSQDMARADRLPSEVNGSRRSSSARRRC